ncbi:type II toxin-antitoxin system HicA family toxin [Sphingobium sp. AP49]|uniref:type II toxin-antitoxin system HicA family toxin n=1 Tax=Sphingobium sp. AP49 TaxID=1144307 RepID=UPI00026EDDB1|nr:type II toxin-antitoxin system HicA family toxin [Sphingobium sp. AP49]WHO40494.1 type II toxin-antitoxin system HicA family toxin [Sphingobium sp. AP49]
MVTGYGRQLERLLLDAGCHLIRKGKGDHEIWFSPISGRSFVFDRGVKVRHTANGILKDAGLNKAF